MLYISNLDLNTKYLIYLFILHHCTCMQQSIDIILDENRKGGGAEWIG